MKKITALVLAILMLMAVSASAADITVTVNGEAMSFDQGAIVEDGVLLLPLRLIAEKLGADVSWYGETLTVFTQLDGNVTTIQIGNDSLFVNGDSSKLEKAPVLVNDRTLVPVEIIEKGIGASVSVDEAVENVIITK